jgi:DAK2 domain fusion protein YloV
VIFSQVLRGIAAALRDREAADGAALREALRAASEAAYHALSNPVEGTILTVVREAAEAAAGGEDGEDLATTLGRAAAAAWESVERTPELLPVLKEAGVVDAGGLAYAIFLEGLLRSLRRDDLDVDLAPDVTVEAEWRSEVHHAEPGEVGYCTEFVVTGERLSADEARARLSELGTSLLVVGNGDLMRVHLHTRQPDAALAYGRSLGSISRVKVDNMETQVQRFMAGDVPTEPVVSTIGVVAVAAGEGIQAAFRSVGISNLVHGGQTMNPSTGEILEAIESTVAEQVVVLPNNKNIIAAAQQAAEQATKRVAVVPSRSIPQGIAAVLALNPDLPFEQNVEAMEQALATVRSGEITRAVRSTTVEGRRVETGQLIGIVDGDLRVVADDLDEAVRACVEAMTTPEASLLTLYAGEDVRLEDAEALASSLQEAYPSLEVELVPGGQPHYLYYLSLE